MTARRPRGRPAAPVADPDAAWVRAQRLAAGLTQRQLAEALGVHEQTVSELERGRRALTRERRAAISWITSRAMERG